VICNNPYQFICFEMYTSCSIVQGLFFLAVNVMKSTVSPQCSQKLAVEFNPVLVQSGSHLHNLLF
jgi:hypothetical protein